MSQLKRAVAFLFRRAGLAEVDQEALARAASLDLHWLSPKDARRFLDAARAQGLVRPGGRAGTLAPTFDLASVELALDFRIGPADLEGAPLDAGGVVADLVEAAAQARGESPERVAAEVAAKASAKLLLPAVAAALVAREAGVDLAPYFERLRRELHALSEATP